MYSPLEAAFPFGFSDDQDALCADANSVNRTAGSISANSLALREPHVRLEAAVRDDLAGPWIGALIRAAHGKRPMKWADVQSLVLHGSGTEAQAVRRALERQVIVVTDPMALAREVDLALVDSGCPMPLAGGALVNPTRPAAGPLVTIGQEVREWVAGQLLRSTGVGTIEALVAQSESMDLMDMGSSEARIRRLSEKVRGKLRHATKLASRSMMLVLHERDPEDRGPSPYRRRWAEAMRFGDPDAMITHVRLRAIATAKIIFDKGEEDVTRVVDGLRAAAERVVAYSPLEDPRMRGFARDGDDTNLLRLQIADIAVGYARAIMEDPRTAHRALAELHSRFRLVLFNGRRLTEEGARRHDADRLRHREIMQRMFGAAA